MMIFLYCVFFGLTDLLLYSLLTNAVKVKKELLWCIIAIILIVTTMHLDIYPSETIMDPKQFWVISKSFLVLILFHFVGGFFVNFIDRRFAEISWVNKNSLDVVIKVFKTILYKGIYIVMFIYQVVEVLV